MKKPDLVRTPVEGAPFQPGDRVRIVRAIDQNVMNMSRYIGREGRVVFLDYVSGVGQSHPEDPMIGVRLSNRKREVFWREELEPCA